MARSVGGWGGVGKLGLDGMSLVDEWGPNGFVGCGREWGWVRRVFGHLDERVGRWE